MLESEINFKKEIMKVLIAGDFCQSHRVDALVKEKRFGELFDDIKPVIASADYGIVNLEFPIIIDPGRGVPIPKCGPNLQGTLDAIEAVKYAGFSCCTLANNHILDYGGQCCLDTKHALEEAGVDTVGIGVNLQEAEKTLYKRIDGKTLAIINCCEHEFSIATATSVGANPLNPVRQFYAIQEARKNADYVLVIVHGGHEHWSLPSPRMKETYRFFIDAGADAVVNHHQHCYSGYETYYDKPIFYGLGNLCFDEPLMRHCGWNEGVMVRLEFKGPFVNYELIPYTQCDENPSVKLMHDRMSFNLLMHSLNIIINDRDLLAERTAKYYASSVSSMLLLHQPYGNRLLNKLYRMRLLPSMVSKKKLLMLLNYLDCESHRDKQSYALKQIIK